VGVGVATGVRGPAESWSQAVSNNRHVAATKRTSRLIGNEARCGGSDIRLGWIERRMPCFAKSTPGGCSRNGPVPSCERLACGLSGADIMGYAR
jgi:hypothetical protein